MLRPILRPTSPGGGSSASARSAGAAPATGARPEQPGPSFRAVLERSASSGAAEPVVSRGGAAGSGAAPPSPAEAPWVGLVRDVDTRRREVDAMLQRALRGGDLGARELLLWQAQVYAYSQQVELVSRIADRTVQGAKQLLNTQL